MNNLFRELNIPHRPNCDLIEFYHDFTNSVIATEHKSIPENKRDKEVVQFLADRGLTVMFSELFYTAPNIQRNIHIDGNTLGIDLFKLNWIYGAAGSTMKWYYPEEGYTPSLQPTFAGTYAYSFDKNKCNLLYETEIKHPCIIHAGIPHTVFNSTNEARWCISYTIGDSETGCLVKWDSLVIKLENYFITK